MLKEENEALRKRTIELLQRNNNGEKFSYRKA
jgi:hypothetical protein